MKKILCIGLLLNNIALTACGKSEQHQKNNGIKDLAYCDNHQCNKYQQKEMNTLKTLTNETFINKVIQWCQDDWVELNRKKLCPCIGVQLKKTLTDKEKQYFMTHWLLLTLHTHTEYDVWVQSDDWKQFQKYIDSLIVKCGEDPNPTDI